MRAPTGVDTARENVDTIANIAAAITASGTGAVMHVTATIMAAGGMLIRGGSMRFRCIIMIPHTGLRTMTMPM